MDEHIDQLKWIFDVTYLTMIIKTDGTYLIDMLTKKYIDSHFKQYNQYDEADHYIVNNVLTNSNEDISLISKANYKIPKKETLQQEKQEQFLFLQTNKNLFNRKASYIANHLDKKNINCIIGDCAFVFNNETFLTEKKLRELVEKF